MNQIQFLTNLCENNKDSVIIGSIGTISYDLNTIDHPKKILVKGAMGSALGIGLGYALGNPKEKVIVVIGDGSFLMKMGTSSTIYKYNPKNLRVFIINNGKYASCGCQTTNFDAIAEKVNHFFFDVFTPRDELAP